MKETWNPAEISEDIKPVNYVNADTWNAAELNEAIDLFGIKYPVDTWNPAELDEKARSIINDITSTKTITGNPISFKTINGGYAKSCEVTFSPIQSGSGDPSPENVRPISGWDSLVLNQCGKNIQNQSLEIGAVAYPRTEGLNYSAYKTSSTIRCRTVGLIYFPTNADNITISCDFTKFECVARAFDSNGLSLVRGVEDGFEDGWSTSAFTIKNAGSFAIMVRKKDNSTITSDDFSDIKLQCEVGASATTYEPYSEETHTATFPDTVYGGELDFASGKAKSEWGYISSYDGETITEPWISDRDVYVAGTTPSTGAEVCYKLATPTEITITPETIELLKGNNVLFTDEGNITLKYTKLALPDDSDGLSLNQKILKAIEIIKGKAINEELKKEETKKSTTKGRRKKS